MLIVNDFGLKKEVRKKVIPELAGKLVGGFEFLLPIDGHNMIIGTEQGFIHYALDEEDQSDTLLQIILSNITASGTSDSTLFGGFHSGSNSPSPDKAPTLQAGMNNLSFSFSATEYKTPALVEYRIQLRP